MEQIKVIKKALNKTSRDGHLISDWVNGTYLAAGEAGSECQATKNSRSAARRDTRSGPVNLRVVVDDMVMAFDTTADDTDDIATTYAAGTLIAAAGIWQCN